MDQVRFLTIAEQAAEYLRRELIRGRWKGEIPGKHRLAEKLGVNNKTVEAALRLLEKDGLLVAQGAGRRRSIVPPKSPGRQQLKVGIFLYEKDDRKLDYIVELVRKLQERGYQPFLSGRSLIGLGMNVKRVAAFVASHPADAWVVLAGSRDVLMWFSQQAVPAFGMLGRLPRVNIAGTGPLKSPAMATALRRLAALGHRRIVLLVREERRKPEPGIVERAFLSELESLGIKTGAYNLPEWEDTPEGLARCLRSLFLHSPPTALIASGLDIFAATQQFLLHHGIRVPQDISIVSSDPHPSFAWCNPSIAHIEYDNGAWVKNAVRWIDKVASGKDDRSKKPCISRFVEGGTIGPVPKTTRRLQMQNS